MATTVAAAAVLLPAPSAFATAPGDNGTVKIHDAATGEELRRNEPHVCAFYLDAFGFDSGEKVNWRIEAWAPTAAVKGEEVEAGALTLDAEGQGRTEDLRMADGHYKLFWNFEGEKGAAKHKVFWSDCAEEPGQPDGPSDSPAPSESAPAEVPQSSPSAPASGEAPAPAASPSSGDDGDLAETGNGAPVGLLAGAAVGLVAAGGGLLVWRRRAQG